MPYHDYYDINTLFGEIGSGQHLIEFECWFGLKAFKRVRDSFGTTKKDQKLPEKGEKYYLPVSWGSNLGPRG